MSFYIKRFEPDDLDDDVDERRFPWFGIVDEETNCVVGELYCSADESFTQKDAELLSDQLEKGK